MGKHERIQQARGRTHRKRFTAVAAVLVGSVIGVAAFIALGTHQYQASEDLSRSAERRTPTSAVSPGGSESNSVREWVSTATLPYNDIQDAMEGLSDSLSAQDVSAVQEDCQRLHDAGRSLEATLPSPDPGLTSEVREAIEAINSGFGECLALIPGSADQPDAEALTAVFTQARTHLDQARQIAQNLLGG